MGLGTRLQRRPGKAHTRTVTFPLKKKHLVLLLAFVAGGLGVTLGKMLVLAALPCHDTYDLINPDAQCGWAKTHSEWTYEPLRNNLIERIADLQETKMVTHVSVYFRELDNGPRFGIEEYDSFYPASLLKVPIMLAVLHAVDADPLLLDEELRSPKTLPESVNVENAQQTIQPDTVYTVRELLEKMIVYSDNDSKNLLMERLNRIPAPTVYDTFLDLGIMSMMDGSRQYVSIQSYAYLFGVLYNAGYLSRDMSQFALDLLSRSTYDDGLVAGVPAGTRVAHKFGHRVLPGGEHQLHDCGIVYHPAKPYVLCLMTDGPDLQRNASVISELSSMVYHHTTTLHTGKP